MQSSRQLVVIRQSKGGANDHGGRGDGETDGEEDETDGADDDGETADGCGATAGDDDDEAAFEKTTQLVR